ncbi:MAG: ScpA family protein [Alphaproteobacteria bacterium]|nr:ScpA family protein [Alphaproteobacteria bacterium]
MSDETDSPDAKISESGGTAGRAANDDFQPDQPDYASAVGDDALVLALDGFEGPIDLLLTLSREHKIDITKISILALAEQYLAYIQRARELQLEIAADYLVMAAWLAYLKSRLLLPVQGEDEDGEDPAELAARLAFQLQRLEAMQNVSQKLLERPRLGQDFFARGMPEQVVVSNRVHWDVSLYELLRAYGSIRQREVGATLRIAPTALFSMDQAVQRLRAVLGDMPDWSTLEQFLPEDLNDPLVRRSALASTFAASLELAREGVLDIQQQGLFAPILIRKASVVRLAEPPAAKETDADDSGADHPAS